MPYAELEGLRLYYERAGRGDPELLFVPGWCCDGTAFQPQFDHFAPTNAVTALDLRGCGRSDRPADGYGIPDLAEDVARFCRAVGIERPVVVGHSLGGMIAVELAGRRPSLLSALDVLRLLEIKPDLAIGVTVGAGHFHQLEVPDQVNAMIDRFLEPAAES